MKVTKEVVQILKDARSILDKPNAWGRGEYAKDNRGFPSSTLYKQACRFCTHGAIGKAANYDPCEAFEPRGAAIALDCLAKVMTDGSNTVAFVNDKSTTKHQHVLMTYDFAILMAEDALRKQTRAALKQAKKK